MAIASPFPGILVYLLEAVIDNNVHLGAIRTWVCIPAENALTIFKIIFLQGKIRLK